MKKHLFRITALLMVFCLLFAGCTTDNGGTTTTSSATTTEKSTTTDSTASTTMSTTESADTTNTATTTDSASTTTASTTLSSSVPSSGTSSTDVISTTTSSSVTASTTKSSTTVSTKTTASTKRTFKVVTTTTARVYTVAEKRDHIGFGYYRMTPEGMDKENAKGHINIQSASMAPYNFESHTLPYLRHTKALGQNQMAWLGIGETIFAFHASGAVQNGNWKEQLASMMDTIEKEGLMDHVLGFYFDEPMLCGIKKNEFRDVTKHLRKTYPELRVFAVFAVNAIDPNVWSSGNNQLLDYDTTQYLTDAGYDMYWDAATSYNSYVKLNKALKERLGRDDVRIWYVPCIMSGGGQGTEKHALTHLEVMYRFLKEEKKPGGLLCYAYNIGNGDGALGNVGYDQNQAEWKELEKRLLQIGKEIQRMNKNGEIIF